jgi:putative ABC transport system ATP-binding protein
MTALRITDLVFRWPRQARNCLEIPQLELAAGERVFLHGPSGSGKSTLLGLLGGVAMPQAGAIELLGTDITRLGGRARDRFRADHIGFLFQQFNLLPWLSALDNVLLPCTFSSRRRARRPLAAHRGRAAAGAPRSRAAHLARTGRRTLASASSSASPPRAR